MFDDLFWSVLTLLFLQLALTSDVSTVSELDYSVYNHISTSIVFKSLETQPINLCLVTSVYLGVLFYQDPSVSYYWMNMPSTF